MTYIFWGAIVAAFFYFNIPTWKRRLMPFIDKVLLVLWVIATWPIWLAYCLIVIFLTFILR